MFPRSFFACEPTGDHCGHSYYICFFPTHCAHSHIKLCWYQILSMPVNSMSHLPDTSIWMMILLTISIFASSNRETVSWESWQYCFQTFGQLYLKCVLFFTVRVAVHSSRVKWFSHLNLLTGLLLNSHDTQLNWNNAHSLCCHGANVFTKIIQDSHLSHS